MVCYNKYVSVHVQVQVQVQVQRITILLLFVILFVLQLQICIVVGVDIDNNNNINNNIHLDNDKDDNIVTEPINIIIDDKIQLQHTNHILFGHVGDNDNNDNYKIQIQQQQQQQQQEQEYEQESIESIKSNPIVQEQIEKQRTNEILFGQVGDNDNDNDKHVHDEEQQNNVDDNSIIDNDKDNVDEKDSSKVNENNDNTINDSNDNDSNNTNDYEDLIPTYVSLDALQLAIDNEIYNWMTGDSTKIKQYNKNILVQKQQQFQFQQQQQQLQQQSSTNTNNNEPIIITLFWIVFIIDTDDCSNDYYTNILYNETFTTVVSTIQSRLQTGQQVQPLPYYAKVQLIKQSTATTTSNTDDTEILYHRFGIQTTPTIIIVVSDIIFDSTNNNQHTTSTTVTPVIVGEYKGITHTNVNIMSDSIVRSYYYYTYLTSLVLTTTTKNNNNENILNSENNEITSQYVRKIRSFLSLQDISYLLYNHRTTLLLPEILVSIKNSIRQSLSLTLPVVERIYIEYLMGWDDYSIKNTKTEEYDNNNNNINNNTTNTNGRTNRNTNVTILVQHRCSISSSSSHDDTANTGSTSSSSNTLDYIVLYKTFDTMGQILSHRQDILFFVLQQQKEDNTDTLCHCHSFDGDITVYSIPSIQLFLDSNNNDIDDNYYFNNTNWIVDYKIPNVKFDPNQYIPSNQQCYVVSESNNESDIDTFNNNYNNQTENQNNCSTIDSNGEEVTTITKRQKTNNSKEVNITLYVHSRLHEFLIKITTPSNNNNNVFWFDHESTSPILFSNGRHVHAILFINMHHTMLHTLIEQELYSIESYNDNEAKKLIKSILQNDIITQRMKYTIQQFQSLCSQHSQNNMYNSNNNKTNSFITNDMVCMVVPSTETRILTIFGIDYWSLLDDIASKAAAGEDIDDNVSSTNIFPTLVITDQRNSIGTKRYYLDLALSSTKLTTSTTTTATSSLSFEEEYEKQYNIMSNFITNFWQGMLQPDIRSDNRGTRINKSGVRIITSQTAAIELFGTTTTTTGSTTTTAEEGSNNEQTNDVQQQHDVTKLLLLVAPSCGHCKRISALWNEMSKFLHAIGWNTIIHLYRIDVTTNDIEVSLNLTSNWLPDVFYVIPSNNYMNNDNNTSSASLTQPRQFIRYLQSPNVDTEMNGGDDGIGTIHDFTEILEWLLFDILEDETINNTTSIFTDTTLRQLYSKLKE